MDLLNEKEVKSVVEQYGNFDLLDFKITNYSETLIGYLGKHLKLVANVNANGRLAELKFFVKCLPKDKWIAQFLMESGFFRKEFTMLSVLFNQFERNEDECKWRPKALLLKEYVFVFEDVKELGYAMANQKSTLNYNETMAVVQTLARFHAQSFIYEEKKSLELQKPYRIWDDFSEYLQEPKNKDWRNAGRNAAIEFLKVFSKHRWEPLFSEKVTNLFHLLFDDAFDLMRPSTKYRNTVVHRDLWSNNILLKNENGECGALIIDFQTVLYCPPTMDLSSLIYMNTAKSFRDKHIGEILDFYYKVLSKEVEDKIGIDFATILSMNEFMESYDESVLFGLTQAAIVIPITAMKVEERERLFCDSESIHRINNVSRTKEVIHVANEDAEYYSRLIDLFEDILDKYYLR
ncbi:uncharacterized protein [Choristoneura fumiferana]|uniref:uncharacterized protein n=1 Tax=Choristoneura fumiferana TaxID=7141 RepID=UPI003D153AA3